MLDRNNNVLAGWFGDSKEDEQVSRANKAIDTFINEQKVKFGIADISFSTPKIFTKAVNDYINALTNAKYYSDDAPQYEVPVWDNRMTNEIGRFLTESKMFADTSFDGSLEKIGEVEKSGKSWTGRTYKYKTAIYKLKIPVSNNPTGDYTTAEDLIIEDNLIQNDNNQAYINTSSNTVKTAYVTGGIVLVVGLIGAVIAAKFKNKNKS